MCFGDHGINQSDYESTLQLLSSEEKYFPKLLDFLERDYPLKGSSQTLDAWREVGREWSDLGMRSTRMQALRGKVWPLAALSLIRQVG